MDQKTEIMVALGVAIGANCIPCFDHLYSKSRELKIEMDERNVLVCEPKEGLDWQKKNVESIDDLICLRFNGDMTNTG